MESKFNIICDSREKTPLIFPNDDCYEEITCAKLDTGDYAIDGLQDLIAIDRKASVAELAQNITEKRFKDVINRMSACKYKFLLLEFNLQNIIDYPIGSNIPKYMWNKIRINSNFIMSFLARIQIENNIGVIFCGDPENAAIMVLKLFKKIWSIDGK